MRVTQNMIDRNLMSAINDSYERLSKLNTQVATGQRVNTISDDVPASEQILQLQRENGRLDAYGQNLDTVDTVMSMATTSLTAVSDAMSRAKELAVQAATGTYNDTDRQAMAAGVDSVISSLLEQANVDNNGAYVFGGEATRTTPYTATTGANGEIQAVNYNGAMTSSEVAVGPSTQANTNYVGSDVLQKDSDLFATVISLRDAIRNNDLTQVNTLIGQLDACHTDVLSSLGMLGERQAQLQVLRTATQSFQQLNSQTISNKQDADVSQVSVQYNSQMALLQMVLKTTAEAIQPTLADFL